MAATKEVSIFVPEIQKGIILLDVVGTSPLICNRMSEKARRELLLPARRKNQAERQSSLKHDPPVEFQASPYRLDGDNMPTLLAVMSSAFKGAMATAALDMPGTKKAQIGRLVYVNGDYTPVYGKPYLFMSVVRSSDINRTPDIRTRAVLPRWAARVSISYVMPLLNDQEIVKLMKGAGVTAGIGDWRSEKGKGNYGQFRIANEDDPELLEVLREGRAVQLAAMNDPEPYDGETAELLSWWTDEVKRRGFSPSAVEIETETEAESEEETDA